MASADLPLLHEWLARPHVNRWYGDRGDYEGVVAHYGPALAGAEPTRHFIIELNRQSIGMVQTYVVVDHPSYAALVGIRDPHTAGVDILIGEEEHVGRGLGSAILRRFVAEIVFARPETTCCVADPDVDNFASVRAFQNAGFRRAREFVDPEDGRVHVLVQRDRT